MPKVADVIGQGLARYYQPASADAPNVAAAALSGFLQMRVPQAQQMLGAALKTLEPDDRYKQMADLAKARATLAAEQQRALTQAHTNTVNEGKTDAEMRRTLVGVVVDKAKMANGLAVARIGQDTELAKNRVLRTDQGRQLAATGRDMVLNASKQINDAATAGDWAAVKDLSLGLQGQMKDLKRRGQITLDPGEQSALADAMAQAGSLSSITDTEAQGMVDRGVGTYFKAGEQGVATRGGGSVDMGQIAEILGLTPTGAQSGRVDPLPSGGAPPGGGATSRAPGAGAGPSSSLSSGPGAPPDARVPSHQAAGGASGPDFSAMYRADRSLQDAQDLIAGQERPINTLLADFYGGGSLKARRAARAAPAAVPESKPLTADEEAQALLKELGPQRPPEYGIAPDPILNPDVKPTKPKPAGAGQGAGQGQLRKATKLGPGEGAGEVKLFERDHPVPNGSVRDYGPSWDLKPDAPASPTAPGARPPLAGSDEAVHARMAAQGLDNQANLARLAGSVVDAVRGKPTPKKPTEFLTYGPGPNLKPGPLFPGPPRPEPLLVENSSVPWDELTESERRALRAARAGR